MSSMFVIGEDSLCCALATKLVESVLGWSLAQPAVDTKGVTNLQKNLSRYTQIARLHPVLCLADTDGQCALQLREQWLPANAPNHFHLRLAVPEIESWIMADRKALGSFLGIAPSTIPDHPDDLPDAKQTIINLAKRSRQRHIRQELVSGQGSRRGAGYNTHLRGFVARDWRPYAAEAHSPSLARAIQRLAELKH